MGGGSKNRSLGIYRFRLNEYQYLKLPLVDEELMYEVDFCLKLSYATLST